MPLVAVASHNPVKQRAVLLGLQSAFPGTDFRLVGVSAPSGVSDQPMTDEETLTGAANRAANARRLHPEADLWVGLEGGVEPSGTELMAFAWVVVLSDEHAGRARSGTFLLPPAVAELVRRGVELGNADDEVFGRSNSKQEEGAVGILTHGAVDRARLYAQAIVLACVPLLNEALYTSPSPRPTGWSP